jgi:hypothetical protein
MKNEQTARPGYRCLYVRWITRKGKKVYPPNGLRAWRIWVRDDSPRHKE